MTASTTIFAQQEQDFENDCEPVDQGVSLPVWIFSDILNVRKGDPVPSLQIQVLRYENGCVASGADI
jgi:hypothetical protein